MTVQPVFLASWMAAEPIPDPPACTSMVSPGSSLCVVEQHVFNRSEGHGRQRRGDSIDAGRGGDQLPGGNVDFFLGEAIEMKTMHAGDVFAQIVASLPACLAKPAGASAVDRHQLTWQHIRHTWTDCVDLAGGFSSDCQRQLALGEGPCRASPIRRCG